MNSLDTCRYETFLRVREFGATHAARFPAGSHGAELFALLDTVISALETQAERQLSGKSSARQSVTSKAAARDELLRGLEAISRTARAMALTSPGLEDKFRAPRNVRDQTLLSLARSFAADAAPLKSEFTRRGLPADFLEDLGADIDNFESAITRKIQGKGTHIAATAAIDEQIEHGIQIVRELDATVRNLLADDAATLAMWLSASRTERPARTARAKQNAAPPPPNG